MRANLNQIKPVVKVSILALLVGGISLSHHLIYKNQDMEHVVLRELYFLPLMLAAFWFGLKGGVTTGLVSCMAFLPVVLKDSRDVPGRMVADILEMALFMVVGLTLGLLRDRERRQQRQARQSQALAAMGQAVASVAHDMKTPLTTIGGFTAQVRRHLPPDDPLAHKLDIVVHQTARLETMVREMLDFARPLTVHRNATDLRGLLEECLEVMGALAKDGAVELRGEFMPTAPSSLMVDAYRVQQAVLNLATNAVQASPAGGVVILRLDGSPREVWLQVLDQGPGIPLELRERVLDPFFTTKKEGTGLGLAIVRKIAEAHGGRLDMADNQPRGMVFTLALPRPA